MSRRMVVGIVVAAIIIALALWYYARSRERSVFDAIRAATEAPIVSTIVPPNPTQGIPELNPIDKINPFRYGNPLGY